MASDREDYSVCDRIPPGSPEKRLWVLLSALAGDNIFN